MSQLRVIVLATENKAKIREIASVIHRLVGNQIEVLTLTDFQSPIKLPDEIGETFCEIATIKARTVSDATGLPAIGDDSGLCVDILGGAPGIRSKRWAGEGLNDSALNYALLDALAPYPSDRSAKFVTCAAISIPGFPIVDAEGQCEGTIVHIPRGSNGFGYDPIFELKESNQTLAQLTELEKNSVSHRARAIENLIKKLDWPQF